MQRGAYECSSFPSDDYIAFTKNMKSMSAGGYYYLKEDVTLTSDVVISGNSGGVYLCLNGHKLNMGQYEFIENEEAGAYIYIHDCGDKGDVIGDVSGTIALADAYHLRPAYYEKLMKGGIVLRSSSYDEQAEVDALTFNADKLQWEFTAKDLPMLKRDEAGDFSHYSWEPVFSEKSGLSDILVVSPVDQGDTDYKLEIATVDSVAPDVALAVSISNNGLMPDESIGDAYMIENGKKVIGEIKGYNPMTDGVMMFEDEEGVAITGYRYSGGKENFYSVEIMGNKYAFVFESLDEIDNGDGFPTYMYTYNYKIVEAESINGIALSSGHPVTGEVFPAEDDLSVAQVTGGTVDSDDVKIKSVQWEENGVTLDSSAKAQAATTYTAHVTLTPSNENIAFAYNAAATVNSKAADNTLKTQQGEFVVSYSLDSSDEPNVNSENQQEDLKEYDVVDGELNWVKGSGKDLTFTIEAPAEKFRDLVIDGKEVSTDDYTYKSGSTIITVKANYLESLAVENHSVEALFSDGKAVTTLTIKDAEEETEAVPDKDVGDNVDSGDQSGNMVILMLLIQTLCIVVAAVVIGKRKKQA